MKTRHAAYVRFSCGTALMALAATGALAQDVEQVVVSSTRLQAAGFNAPTPTTMVSAADLEKTAQPNVFDAVTQLPALQGSTGSTYNSGSTTTGLQGLSAFGLRGLSPLRTLVLLNGQRVVGANFNGVVDVSQLPQVLIERVDVVTGGASASWGSDAIAGVVNFVTNKKFVGFKANFNAGVSTYGDDPKSVIQMAAGTSFAGGRGHFEAAVEASYSGGLNPLHPVSAEYGVSPTIGGRAFYSNYGTANYGAATPTSSGPTPAGQPQMTFGPLFQSFTNANSGVPYGIVTNGPKIGTTFGANSQALPFAPAGSCTTAVSGTTGTLAGSINGSCLGTTANPGDQTGHAFTQALDNPLTRGTAYMRVSYDLTPDTEIYAEGSYGEVRTQVIPAAGQTPKTALSIRCDNAYLPGTNLFGTGQTGAATQAACLTSYPGNAIQFSTLNANWPLNQEVLLHRSMRRFVVGGDGAFNLFDKKWTWESYFQHGETGSGVRVHNEALNNRYNLAMDAVQASNGQIVCRDATARSFGCVPFNPFGTGAPSASSIAYMDNQSYSTTLGPSAVVTQRQEAFSFVLNGSPVETWAGPVSVATGYEYREEFYTQRVDPYAGGLSASTPATIAEPCTDPSVDCVNGNSWNAGNFHDGRGIYHVNEAFVELGVPLLNDKFWGKIDLSLAGRVAKYSTAGQANTWKVGGTWDTPIPGIRVRGLMSRDIRAPNLSELFAPAQGLNGFINNTFVTPTFNNEQIRALNEGNPDLKVEKGQTTELGVVYQPEWFPGFQASVDYYRIGVKGVVTSLGAQNVFDLCFGGNQLYCQQNAITTANGVNVSQANPGLTGQPNQITQVHSKAFNSASLITDGFDMEAGYDYDLGQWEVPGALQLRLLANHTSKFLLSSGIPGTQQNTELAGSLGGGTNSQTYNQTGGNVLLWKIQATQSYQNDVWGVTLTERWLGPGVFTEKNVLVCAPGTCPPPTIQTPTINFNKVDSAFYLDVGANWQFSEHANLYGKVDNVANLMPPNTGGRPNNTLYDVIGRMYRIGVRFNTN
jgi:outer membrane receptor protein involved in Fe transport